MARAITFLSRQYIQGYGASGTTEVVSAPFDVSDYPSIVAEFRVFYYSGAGTLSAILQETSDPSLDPSSWKDLATGSATATGVSKITAANPQRYVRCRVVVPTALNAQAHVEGVAREST